MKDMLTSLILNIDTSYEELDEIISCKTEYIDPYNLFDSFTNDEIEECINDIYLEALKYDIDYQNNIEIYLDYLDYISQKDEDIFDDEDDIINKIGRLKYNEDNKFDYFEDIPSKEEIEEYFGRHTLDDEPYGYIYKVSNKQSCRVYIGQTTNCITTTSGKFKRYTNGWLNDKQHKMKQRVQEDIMRYGYYSFRDLKIIAFAYSQDELDTLEAYYIKKYNSIEKGYNIAKPKFVSVKKMKSINN